MALMDDLWLPPGVIRQVPSLAGRNVETGGHIIVHSFKFHSQKHGKTREVRIPADDSMSKAQIEDMAASALETWLIELDEEAQRKVGKHAPATVAERKEVGKAIREFRVYAARRRESTNQKTYYSPAKVEG